MWPPLFAGYLRRHLCATLFLFALYEGGILASYQLVWLSYQPHAKLRDYLAERPTRLAGTPCYRMEWHGCLVRNAEDREA